MGHTHDSVFSCTSCDGVMGPSCFIRSNCKNLEHVPTKHYNTIQPPYNNNHTKTTYFHYASILSNLISPSQPARLGRRTFVSASTSASSARAPPRRSWSSWSSWSSCRNLRALRTDVLFVFVWIPSDIRLETLELKKMAEEENMCCFFFGGIKHKTHTDGSLRCSLRLLVWWFEHPRFRFRSDGEQVRKRMTWSESYKLSVV